MTRRRPREGSGLWTIAVVLAVLVVAAIAFVRFLQTERGEAFLLDTGFGGRYEKVQRSLGVRIVSALEEAGIGRKQISEEHESNVPDAVVVLRVKVPREASLVWINNRIDRAISAGGGRVRTCREERGGQQITMLIGTRRKVTHRCVIRKGRLPGKPARERPAGPALAILVDDFGYSNGKLVKEFLSLGVPLSVSVIPGLRYSEAICRQGIEAGMDVICHLPMEPERGADDDGDIPLIRVSMKDSEIRKITERALETTPGVVGMNNHMGSRATADRRVMKAVLGVCRKQELFFIDSMTSPGTVVSEVAREAGVKSTCNDLFIDNKESDTRESMEKLLSLAARRGSALGIMHVKRKSLEHLRWLIGEAGRREIELITVSGMIERRGGKTAEGGGS